MNYPPFIKDADGRFFNLETTLNHEGETSAPKYLSTPNSRIALISVNFAFTPEMLAGAQTPRIKGRPGINGIGTYTHIELPQEQLDLVGKIADECGINDRWKIGRARSLVCCSAGVHAEPNAMFHSD